MQKELFTANLVALRIFCHEIEITELTDGHGNIEANESKEKIISKERMSTIIASSVKMVTECSKYFDVWEKDNHKKTDDEIKFKILNQC